MNKLPKVVYVPGALAKITLPHRDLVGCSEYSRINGDQALSIIAPAHIGLPWGSIARTLIIYMATHAKIKGSRDIYLGSSFRSFLAKIGYSNTGGKNGSVTRVREQLRKVLASTISFSWSSNDHSFESGMRICDFCELCWDSKSELQGVIRLSEQFYQELTWRAVPIRWDSIVKLRRSPLAVDVYIWLTYRSMTLVKQTCIPWVELEKQFGSNYRHTRHFEDKFIKSVNSVKRVYPELNAIPLRGRGLLLMPYPPDILPVDKPVIYSKPYA